MGGYWGVEGISGRGTGTESESTISSQKMYETM